MTKEIKIATGGLAEEFRALEIGESVWFPVAEYKYGSIRATPSTSLIKERMDGMRWRTQIDDKNKAIKVTRIA